MNKRMNKNRLNIGAYILQPYARTEQHIKDLSDCGIDFVASMDYDTDALDLFAKYGVGAVVKNIVPFWWGGDGKNAGKLQEINPVEKYETAASSFVDHPAIWGIDIGDEPSALDFPYYGKIFGLTEKLFPNQFTYLNLYPNYASVAKNTDSETLNQLGTPTYGEHIERYCQCVPSDYICYDFYPYTINISKHYENLRIISDACRKTGRSMWIVLQVNSNKPEEYMSENNLRFQAYSSMAFGAQNIIWACYTAGWFYNQVLDDNGNKTEQYEKLKKINREIRIISEEYMRFRNVSTHFVGFKNRDDMNEVNQKDIETLNTGIFFDVHGESNTPLVIGQMVSRNNDGAVALMIFASDDPYDRKSQSTKILFKALDGKKLTAIDGSGKLPVSKENAGYYSVTVSSNDGVLIIAE